MAADTPKVADKAEVTKAAEPQMPPQPARKPPTALSPERFKNAEFERQVHVANADEGTQPGDLLSADYWSHAAAQMKPWDRIEVRANDGTWFAELLVLDVSRNWAKVAMLSLTKLTSIDVSQSGAQAALPYRVEYKGPQLKWVVIRKTDQEVVHSGETSVEGATLWMNERIKAG